jgi:hypothetical protein
MTRFLQRYRLRRQLHGAKQSTTTRGPEGTFSPNFRFFFYLTGYLSAYTGFLLLFFFRKSADFYPSWKQALLKTHIFSVVAWLFLCGMLFSIHVIPQLRARIRVGRKSGIALIVLLMLMSVTGYGIQVMPTGVGIDLSRYGHLFSGIGFTVLFGAHLILVRPRLRTALASATLVSLLVALPFFFLKTELTLPDEIKLNPMGMNAPGLPRTGSASVGEPMGMDTQALPGVKKN